MDILYWFLDDLMAVGYKRIFEFSRLSLVAEYSIAKNTILKSPKSINLQILTKPLD